MVRCVGSDSSEGYEGILVRMLRDRSGWFAMTDKAIILKEAGRDAREVGNEVWETSGSGRSGVFAIEKYFCRLMCYSTTDRRWRILRT